MPDLTQPERKLFNRIFTDWTDISDCREGPLRGLCTKGLVEVHRLGPHRRARRKEAAQ